MKHTFGSVILYSQDMIGVPSPPCRRGVLPRYCVNVLSINRFHECFCALM